MKEHPRKSRQRSGAIKLRRQISSRHHENGLLTTAGNLIDNLSKAVDLMGNAIKMAMAKVL